MGGNRQPSGDTEKKDLQRQQFRAVLSKRMQAVADMVTPGTVAADIGCDHGFVSIYLVQQGICPRVYAADVRPGPLQRAKEHISAAGLADCITPILSDGLQHVPTGEQGACSMVAAGIGGRLTIRILSDMPQKTKGLKEVILEPQSEVHLVRSWLRENDFVIVSENMVFEDGKYYPVIRAVKKKAGEEEKSLQRAKKLQEEGLLRWTALQEKDKSYTQERWQQACDRFGLFLILEKNPVLEQFLQHTIEKDRELLTALPQPEKAEDENAAAQAKRIDERRAQLQEDILTVSLIQGFWPGK